MSLALFNQLTGGPKVGASAMPQLPPLPIADMQAVSQAPQGAPPAPQMPAPAGPPPGLPNLGGALMQMPPQAAPQPPAGPPPAMPQMQGQAPYRSPVLDALLAHVASQGIGGDKLMVHAEPGAILVPPAVQTPKLTKAIGQVAKQQGIDPRTMVAGASPGPLDQPAQ